MRSRPPTEICTTGLRSRSSINRGDSGGPLLVRGWWDCAFRPVGVTALGSDSTMDLYAGFTSIPVEAGWIAQSIKALRLG
ncbi:MAG TPA: trypsin-like serine protease [Acidimicrobiales bacterium]|nr:trypsin-like serine protease [Acidimicrobiales bacterium]